MKKILLATTVLVGTAGFAAAEVTLSGDARMGIANTTGDAAFSSRARVKFSLAGETDGGLTFAASFRAADAAGAGSGTKGSVSVSGAFGTLSMGDNDDAALTAVGQVAGVGYTGLGDLNEISYLGNATTNVLYTYSAGDLMVAASAGQVNSDDIALGASYKIGDYTVAAGYEDNGGADAHLVIGGSAAFGPVAVKAVYGTLGDNTQYAASATYTADALSATVFHNMDLTTDNTTNGVGVGYDLGGGAAVAAGLAKEEGSDAVYDAGLTFSF